jgi:tetratricopeptide (TPR) repeat protein
VKLCAYVFLLAALLCPAAIADDGPHHHDPGEQLGAVSFPVSCAPAVQAPFNRGVALLHSFWYEEAEKQFAAVSQQDSTCAMAHWGVAMSLYHQLWDRPDQEHLKRGWAEVKKAQKLHASTPREREYIAAVAAFYGSYRKKDHPARATAYSEAMAKLYADNPNDLEAGAFYALSLLASEPQGDTTFVNRKKAIAILNPLFEKDPNHPGLAHYLIHSCDKPQLASLGLEAARRYAQIAPSSAHAVHMPSHIFARLGLWQDDIHSNLASIAATRKASAMHMGGAAHQLHAMDFLIYAYLQVGEEGEAKKLVDDLNSMSQPEAGDNMAGYMAYARAEFPAMYTLEMRHWSEAAALVPPPNAEPVDELITYWARSIGAARAGDLEGARKDAQHVDELIETTRKSKYGYAADDLAMTGDEVRAWVAFAAHDNEQALRLMRAVADKQDAVGKGEVDIPAREMLADMLLEMNRPDEALAEYQRSMTTDPNRFNGLYGAASAAELAHHSETANQYYAQLLKNCDNGAHSDRPELARARTLLAKE